MKPRIIFSHGNSFPASTYRVLFDNLRQRGFQVDAIEKFGHDPKYPVTNNWPHLVQQLADFAHEKQGSGGPAFLVGHSLGGILSLMCAARHPELARGVVLVDSPVLGGWRATTLGQTHPPDRRTLTRAHQPKTPPPLAQRPSGAGELCAQKILCTLGPASPAGLH